MSSLLAIEGWYTEKNPNQNQTPPLGQRLKPGPCVHSPGRPHPLPRIVTGNYLSFATGPDASYIKPQFVPGNAVTVRRPTPPARATPLMNGNHEGGNTPSPLARRLTCPPPYATWTPNTNTSYTVVFWKQQVTDNKNATNAQKKYDSRRAVSGRTATTGTSVSNGRTQT